MTRARSFSISSRARAGFALLEAMLAVAIFALGILGLGRCISQGMAVERLEVEDARVCRILENRAAEIETGAGALEDSRAQIDGITLTQTREALHKKDEQGAELEQLFLVKLEGAWTSRGERQSRTLNLYVWAH